MKPITARQQTLIVNNVVKAIHSGIDNLKNPAYTFLMLSSGFIAHYNRYGFIANYQQRSLKRDIINNAASNQWNNFRPGDDNYEYYMSKKETYNRIVSELEK